MREAVKWGVEQNKRTVRMIKLERLLGCGVGTSKVEKLGLRLAKEANGGRRGPAEEREMSRTIRRKVMMIMKDKLQDAERDLKLARIQFHKSKKQLWKVVPWPSRAGAGAREVIKVEMSVEWVDKMESMTRSVNFLADKFRRGRLEKVPNTWRGVKVSDAALGDGLQLPPAFLSNSAHTTVLDLGSETSL